MFRQSARSGLRPDPKNHRIFPQLWGTLVVATRLSAMHSLGKRISPVQFRVRAPFLAVRKDRSRASAQVGFISPLCPGQHRRLRPFSPPCSSLRISFVKNSCRSIAGWRLHQLRSRSPMQRHDVESVASVGATPAASTIFRESKPQQTGTGLLIRLGEVATTSGSTIFASWCNTQHTGF